MDLESAHRQVEELVSAIPLGVPVLYENVSDYNFADLPNSLFDGDSTFVRASVEISDSRRLEINPNPASFENGFIEFDIYLKAGYGVRELYKLLDLIESDIKHKTINGINIRERSKVGDFKVGKWVLYSYQYHFVFCK